MEQTECSETLAHKLQTPVNHPEESIQHSEQGESLQSRIACALLDGGYCNLSLHIGGDIKFFTLKNHTQFISYFTGTNSIITLLAYCLVNLCYVKYKAYHTNKLKLHAKKLKMKKPLRHNQNVQVMTQGRVSFCV
jgi:amino acid transporter